jgi:ABC-type multidrug transport system permease subunit
MIGFQSNIGIFFSTIYSLAMASTALAVFLGCSVEDPKLATEMMPLLFVPQMLFAGFFVPPSLIPSWLSWAQYVSVISLLFKLVNVNLLSNVFSVALHVNVCSEDYVNRGI